MSFSRNSDVTVMGSSVAGVDAAVVTKCALAAATPVAAAEHNTALFSTSLDCFWKRTSHAHPHNHNRTDTHAPAS